jgi:ketosteroid isomerase-like protein
MSEHDDFRAWVDQRLVPVEIALHTGDAQPRKALWSSREPVSVLGAVANAFGRDEVERLFDGLAASFSDFVSYELELKAFDVVGDVAWTAGFEHSSLSVFGKPTSYVLRATQTYRREDGEWRVCHRHGDGLDAMQVDRFRG